MFVSPWVLKKITVKFFKMCGQARFGMALWHGHALTTYSSGTYGSAWLYSEHTMFYKYNKQIMPFFWWLSAFIRVFLWRRPPCTRMHGHVFSPGWDHLKEMHTQKYCTCEIFMTQFNTYFGFFCNSWKNHGEVFQNAYHRNGLHFTAVFHQIKTEIIQNKTNLWKL